MREAEINYKYIRIAREDTIRLAIEATRETISLAGTFNGIPRANVEQCKINLATLQMLISSGGAGQLVRVRVTEHRRARQFHHLNLPG